MINSFLASNYEEVSYDVFYRDVFPVGSFEKKGIMEDGKYNGIAVSIASGDKKIKRYTVTDDLDVIDDLVASDDFCLMSPISYIGKSRKSNNARFMYAMAIDMDGVQTKENLIVFGNQILKCDYFAENGVFWGIPEPTYIVSSGTGMHLYYVFKKPVAMFPNVVSGMERLKRRLTWQIWTQGASQLHDNVQYESLFQGFRMVGTITKTGERVRAFKVGNKVDLDFLNRAVPEEWRATQIQYKSDLTLDQAKEKYPEWYENKVVKGERNYWTVKRDLYDWWIQQIKKEENGASYGHRYFCIMTLVIYGIKCGLSKDEIKQDAIDLIPFLNGLNKEEPFTEEDIKSALECYDERYNTFPLKDIEKLTNIRIERNKRNGRKQEMHLKGARAIRDINNPNWRDGNGRKPKKDIVQKWRLEHPEGKKADCIRDTGLDKKTVYKWWFTNQMPKTVLNHATVSKKQKFTDEQIIQMFVTDIMSGLSAEEITEKVVQAVDPNSSTEEKDRILELVQSTQRTMKNILDFTKK